MVSFIHLSDLHILEDLEAIQYGVNCYQRLECLIAEVNSLRPRPSFAVITGDLVSDGREGSYHRLSSLLCSLELPTHFALGNHDDRQAFRKALLNKPPSEEPIYASFNAGGFHFVILDTLKKGSPAGFLEEDQLSWLRADLEGNHSRPTFLFIHHHVLPIRIRWLDELKLENADDLLEILEKAGNIKWVFYGHVHQNRLWRYKGIVFASPPSTGFQVPEYSQTMMVTDDPPGFRLVEAKEDGVRTYLKLKGGKLEPDPPLEAIPIYIR